MTWIWHQGGPSSRRTVGWFHGQMVSATGSRKQTEAGADTDHRNCTASPIRPPVRTHTCASRPASASHASHLCPAREGARQHEKRKRRQHESSHLRLRCQSQFSYSAPRDDIGTEINPALSIALHGGVSHSSDGPRLRNCCIHAASFFSSNFSRCARLGHWPTHPFFLEEKFFNSFPLLSDWLFISQLPI